MVIVITSCVKLCVKGFIVLLYKGVLNVFRRILTSNIVSKVRRKYNLLHNQLNQHKGGVGLNTRHGG